jgi:ferredoxin-NADP reductase
MPVKTFPIILEDAYQLSPSVKHFVFKCDLDPVFDFTPGQFITIHFEEDGKTIRRSYSIANIPKQNNLIEFAAGYVEGGPGTELLFNLKPGDAININGPFGRLTLKEDTPERFILVATSTGVTPYRAMIPALKARLDTNPKLKVIILQGVQHREDILYCDEFHQFATEHPRVTFHAHLSRETEALQTHERAGYVQGSFPMLSLNPDEDIVYLCGNPGMIDESFAYLKDKGFALQRIIREKYISSK